MSHLHLAYLQQVSQLVEDKHKPLAAHYGFIAKKISQKHLVHVRGYDSAKLRRCKACQAPITNDDIVIGANNSLIVRCPLSSCGFTRRFSNSRESTQKQKKRKERQKIDDGEVVVAKETFAKAEL